MLNVELGAIADEFWFKAQTTEYFEIKKGLKAGDRVVTSSYERIRDGDLLEVSDVVVGRY